MLCVSGNVHVYICSCMSEHLSIPVSVSMLLLLLLSHFSRVQLYVTPWTAAHQASLSITNSQSLLKCMSIELVMLSSVVPSLLAFNHVNLVSLKLESSGWYNARGYDLGN